MTDRLKIDYINSLPQPLLVAFGASDWPVFDIDVETGLLRIDVIGRLEVRHIGEAIYFTDAEGGKHDSEAFYCDLEPIE
jgi:hypothetical protein